MPSLQRLPWLPLLLMLVLAGCTEDEAAPAEDPGMPAAEVSGAADPSLDQLFADHEQPFLTPPAIDTSAARAWVDSTLAALSLEEKIGQLFIVEVPGGGLRGLLAEDAAATVQKHHVGGFLVRRLMAPRDVYDLTRRLQEAADVPLFFAADYERGVGRFSNAMTELPSNMAIGATRDPTLAAAAGRLTAIEARATGVNLLFAPVVDVNNNPANPIINIRSYGEDPHLVAEMAAAFVREAEQYGVLTTLKHFPGHGDTDTDSHARMGVIRGNRAKLDSVELRPYATLFDQDEPPSAIMSAHLWVEAWEDEPLPATFSRPILTDLLRDSLGFEGLVITDDVKMGALNATYDLRERILRPIEAGADIVLTPERVSQAVRIVRDAIEEGRLTEARLDRSVRRILEAKASIGLHREPRAREEALDYLMEKQRGEHIARTIADESVTLLKGGDRLPIAVDSQRVQVVHLTNYRGSESIGAAMDALNAALGAGGAQAVRFDENPSAGRIDEVVERASEADVIVLALYLRLQAGRGEAGLFARQNDLAEALVALDVPVVLVTFGNPYAVSDFEAAESVIVAYDQALATVRSVAQLLQGQAEAPGRLPIAVRPFAYGEGAEQAGTLPVEVGR